jgi:hypothetical protein
VARTLVRGWHREHLRRAQHLAKALILAEVKRLSATVINMRQHNRSAIGETKFVAPEWRNPSRIYRRRVIEVVARIECGVAQELENRPMHARSPGPCNDIGVPGAAASDLGRHPA